MHPPAGRPLPHRRDPPLPTTAARPSAPRRLTKETPISPARQADPELDSLIEEITVDCHDEYEQLTGFENAFDEDANLPCPGTVVGENVDVLSVVADDDRHELIATCQRNGHRYQIALLDIDLTADPATSRMLAAYRRWPGT